MTIRLAINGYGRIGRNILRAFFESAEYKALEIVAINDLGDAKTNAHLTQFDTTHGRFSKEVRVQNDNLWVEGHEIKVLAERNPEKLPWKALDIDVVLECTGFFASKAKSEAHLKAGAKKVLISAPAGNDLPTIVFGINDNILTKEDRIVSNASCTTNCLAPLVKVLHESVGIESGLMNTIHAYTNDQVLTDVYHSDLRRARSATHSLIPTKTGAAAALGLVFPELKGKLDGLSIRVPVINVSLVDFTFTSKKQTTEKDINEAMIRASEGALKNILVVNELPLVSSDFNHNPASSIFDATQTRVIDKTVKVLAWYDNEWGFSNRMLDTATVMGRLI